MVELKFEFEFEKFLGEGSSGSVSLYNYKGRRGETLLNLAVKTSEDAKTIRKEFQIMSEFKGCPRIVRCYGDKVLESVNKDGDVEYKLPMEYASGGTLMTFMERFKDKKVPDPLIRKFTCMILEGLATIHRRGYVHCDIKPENILVFPSYKGTWRPSYELKICDFGLARREGDTKWWTPIFRYAGTAIYMSPESISHGEISKGLDLWSLGCVVLEMYTGKKPWWHTDYDLEYLEKCYEPLVPMELPFDARHFIMTCFAWEIEERKDALTLMKHCFVRGDVNKIVDPPVKNETRRDIEVEFESIRQKLSEIRSMCVKIC